MDNQELMMKMERNDLQLKEVTVPQLKNMLRDSTSRDYALRLMAQECFDVVRGKIITEISKQDFDNEYNDYIIEQTNDVVKVVNGQCVFDTRGIAEAFKGHLGYLTDESSTGKERVWRFLKEMPHFVSNLNLVATSVKIIDIVRKIENQYLAPDNRRGLIYELQTVVEGVSANADRPEFWGRMEQTGIDNFFKKEVMEIQEIGDVTTRIVDEVRQLKKLQNKMQKNFEKRR